MASEEMSGDSAGSPELVIGLIVFWTAVVAATFYLGGLQGAASFWSLVLCLTLGLAIWSRNRIVSVVFLALTFCSGMWLWHVMQSFFPHP